MAQPAFGGTDNGSVLPVQPLVQPPPGNDQVVLPSSVALDTNHAAALPANENRGKQRQKQQQQRKQKSQQPTRQAKVMTHSRIGRSKKRSKVQVDGNKLKNEPTLPKTSLHDLPLETLDLILAYMSTEGLATMLSVNRYFNHYLKDPVQSSRMWRRARESFLPCPLPPPPTDISENDYGRWLFGWLPCEICEKPTNRVPTSISLRAKLCLNPGCGKKWAANLVLASGNHILFYQAIPFVEQQLDTDQRLERIRHLALWRRLKATRNPRLFRQTDVDSMRERYLADEQAIGYLEAMNKWTALAKGVPAKVKSYEPVILWAAEFELHMRDTRKANDKLLREEAIKRGWDICNIYNAEALRRVIRVANASGESILPFLERETVIFDADAEIKKLAVVRTNRQHAKQQKRAQRGLVRLHRAIFETAEMSGAIIPIPPLAVFKNFSSVNSVVQTGHPTRVVTKGDEEAEDIKLRIVQEVTQWQHSALDMFAKLLPREVYTNAEPAPSTASLKAASRPTALFRCIHCTKVEAELRADLPPRTLGKNAGAWRAMTIAQASQHKCGRGSVAKSNNNPDIRMERRLSEPTHGLEYDAEAGLAVTKALAAANVDVATAKVDQLETLGPIFRCRAGECGLTMVFSRIKYHVLRHACGVELECVDDTSPQNHPAKTDDFFDVDGNPVGAWDDALKKVFKCRHCGAQPFNARAIRQHMHDRHTIDSASFASEDFSQIVNATAMDLT